MSKKYIALIIVVAIPLFVGFWSGYSVGRHSPAAELPQSSDAVYTDASLSPASSRDTLTDQISNDRRNAITRAVAGASPAVVGINVTEVREYRDFWSSDPFFRQFFGDRVYRQEVKGLGSGFIISPEGYILTNDHVAGNAKEITVTLTNGEKYKAKLVGTDMVSDISLLKIDGGGFPYLKLGNSDDVIIGEWVIAMGNPFGLFEISDKPTVTVGVVSATGMNLNAEGGRFYRGMIQTDAAINSGNSGGPLLNSLGEVIGVNAVIFTPNQGSIGLGFAIPINRVKGVVAELKKNGKIERDLWTGLEIQTVDARVARYFGLDRIQGVIVSDVKRNSPGERAGFKVGDIILEANGEAISSDDQLIAIVTDAHAGDVLSMKVMRDKQIMTLKLRLERNPS
jgi:serine protease Do